MLVFRDVMIGFFLLYLLFYRILVDVVVLLFKIVKYSRLLKFRFFLWIFLYKMYYKEKYCF